MDETHLHPPQPITATISNEETPSFILQQSSSNGDQHQDYSSNQQTTPLLISQIYEKQFYDNFHMNYYGELEQQGVFVASIRCMSSKPKEVNGESTYSSSNKTKEDNIQMVYGLIRTDLNNYHVSDKIDIDREKNLLEILLEKAQLPSASYSEYIDYIKANEKVLQFDKWNDDQYSIKVAFVFQRSNQRSENEIFSNNQMSKEMEQFLDSISDRIELKDFGQYRGDLDTKSNLHGLYSYFTKFENHQIMFNVSPMISSDENDKYIKRKSLIANALVCIVFQEKGSQPYQPNLILGKVTQVYIVVQPIDYHGGSFYQVEIWRRTGIEPIPNPLGRLWKKNELLRKDFLTLIIDSINCILRKEFFQKRIVEQRQRLKNETLKKLCHFFHTHARNRLSISNNKSEEDIHLNTSNTSKNSSRKHRRHSFIPKFFATLGSNRAESPTEQSDRTNDSTVTFVTYLDKSNEDIHQSTTRPSRITPRKSLPNVHNKIPTNFSAANEDHTD